MILNKKSNHKNFFLALRGIKTALKAKQSIKFLMRHGWIFPYSYSKSQAT